MNRYWRLDDQRQTLVLASINERLPEVIYWGGCLPNDECLATLGDAHRIDVTGGMLDIVPALSICPNSEDCFAGQPGMVVHSANGALLSPAFRFSKETTSDRKISLEFEDAELGLTLTTSFEITAETSVITTKNALKSRDDIRINWLAAPVVPGPSLSSEMLDFSGRWCREFQIERTPWRAGIRMRENRTGRTGHEHFPGLYVPETGATNTKGNVFAFHLGWSGGHRMIAEQLPDGRRQIQFGAASGSETEPCKHYETPALYMTYTPDGLNGAAVSFQRQLRDHIITWPKPKKPRPVHYNCWEAIYFDHDVTTLNDIATRAADLGAERFVLDDGWFGKRDDDTSSLGDWQIDARKYPEGLGPLVDHVNGLDMGFGLWFEPEMINPQSALYRAHPDWVLGALEQPLGRQQLVLDLARTDVRNHLFDCIDAILTEYNIEYIKWDHNRVLPVVSADQTRGIYSLLDRLRTKHPDVEIESCASGGGRIDAGILEHTQRVWLSDSNDAKERLHIQHNAALFLPAAATGSHVGPRLCHTSGRKHDIRFRAWVAASRHMGFEMDPRELTQDEEAVLRRVTQWWKYNRDWLMRADILRLDSSQEAIIAEQHQSVDTGQFVVFVGYSEALPEISPRPLTLTGLDPNAYYEISLLNKEDAHHLSRGSVALKEKTLRLSGAYLMNHGITLPWSFPDRVWVVEGKKL